MSNKNRNRNFNDIPTEKIVEMAEEAVESIDSSPRTYDDTWPVPEPKKTDIPENVRIVWDSVDVRLGDSMFYKVIGTVTKGKIYPVVTISAETGWYALRIPGYILWVPAESVEAV